MRANFQHIRLKALSLLASCSVAALANTSGNPVGEVTLVIGQQSIVSASGQSQPASRGAALYPGDTIQTSSGGHVHVRFNDGALVSIRPASRFVIEQYSFDARNPGNSTVRFTLENGTARAISGAAAEAAKERFRLNTPLVAIGVRGTDFVVNSQPDKTVASVNQGAIIMTPFGDRCSPGDLGPCSGNTAQLLSADMGYVLAEFTGDRVKPIMKVAAAPKVDAASTKPPISTNVSQAKGDEGEVASPSLFVASSGKDNIVNALLTDISAQTLEDTKLPVHKSALAWGRWALPQQSGDISEHYQAARDGREITVGSEQYALYRAPGSFNGLPASPVNFNLSAGYAQYNPAGRSAMPAQIQGGQLALNFAERSFATTLQLYADAVGSTTLQATGGIDADGLFRSQSAGQSVAGAVAFDAKSAGYLFQKATENGALKGITLWSK